MNAKEHDSHRAETDASLRAERHIADRELQRRVLVADEDADEVLRIARERADRLLRASRNAADQRLPAEQQSEDEVAALLQQRDTEDRTIAAERELADELLDRERAERSARLSAQLVVEREATDLHLAFERRTADSAVNSRDDFLAQASHDLRGLLAAQKIYLSLLAREASGRFKSSTLLATNVAALIKIEAQMDRLISDLVDLVAIEAGKLAVTPCAHSALELLSTATAVFEPLAKEREQALAIEPAVEDVSIHVDLARGVQVLGNLLSNAIKFTPSKGSIRAGFEASEREVTFYVADTGPDVPADRVERIFERFVGSSGASSGLGLGLFIAARIVEAHSGRIWLDGDSAPGSVFRFTLRRA